MRPSFLERLTAPSVRKVMICGCGGGFDFLHGLLLWPELRAHGKQVVLGSCSWGDPDAYGGDAETVFEDGDAVVKRVTALSTHDPAYAPEVHTAAFLDARDPAGAPHAVYAYNARMFAVPTLTRFFEQVTREHDVDAMVLVDGGSDSLMAGDEGGLGDPVEDAVSLASAAALDDVGLKVLLSVGLGLDRHNGVSDVASLRAVSELVQRGGFLGAVALERSQPGAAFYVDLVRYFVEQDAIRSAVPGVVLSVLDGHFGAEAVPPHLQDRVRPGSMHLNPLMGIVWAFDAVAVAARSRICAWVRDAATPRAAHEAVREGRKALSEAIRPLERWPDTHPWRYAPLYDGA